MAKVKKTKNELKAQREALARYRRFLPTLELKKQQLQREVRQVETTLRQHEADEIELRAGLRSWIKLLGDYPPIESTVRVERADLDTANIAGVSVPALAGLTFARPAIDYFDTPAWFEDAVSALQHMSRLRIERHVLGRQRDLLAEELRITSQRVNLFEKVMIPRTEDNIRIIQISQGDAQTAAVARAKLAKGKGQQLLTGAAG
jgi:V/A-type H+/Na+-transporting ATPase subunit D